MADTFQTFTLADAKRHIRHALHGEPSADLPAIEIANRALLMLVRKKPWNWRRRSLVLAARASAATTSIVRAATGIVTLTLTAHGLLPGDWFTLNGSVWPTSPGDGVYTVLTAATADTLTFYNAGTAETAGTQGNVISGRVALPTDFAELETLNATSASPLARCYPVDMAELLDRRRGYITFASGDFWYCVNTINQAATTSEPTYVLEIAPVPKVDTIVLAAGTYFRKIPLLVADNDMPDIPGQLHDLWINLCRGLATTNEEEVQSADWSMFNNRLDDESMAEDNIDVAPRNRDIKARQSGVKSAEGSPVPR